jgi:hypothetical protein
MRNFFIIFFTISLSTLSIKAQNVEQAFHNAAQHYIAGQKEQAKQSIYEGLAQEPNDRKLRELLQKLLEEEQQQQQNSQQNEQKKEQQDQQQDDSQDQQENQDSKDSKDQNEQEQGQKQRGEQGEQKQQESKDKDQQNGKKREEELSGEQSTGEQPQEGKEEGFVPSTAEKLKEMNISKEKAKMVLEAMENSEKQYLQQLRRRSSKKKDRNKPDW